MQGRSLPAYLTLAAPPACRMCSVHHGEWAVQCAGRTRGLIGLRPAAAPQIVWILFSMISGSIYFQVRPQSACDQRRLCRLVHGAYALHCTALRLPACNGVALSLCTWAS